MNKLTQWKTMALVGALATALSHSVQARDVIHRWCPPDEVVPVKAVSISADALFYFDKSSTADMLPEGKAKLDELVKSLNNDFVHVDHIAITGHTDRLGTEAYNLALGQARAETVKNYLQQRGVNISMTANSLGESQPVVYCEGEKPTAGLKACLQPNRRVAIEIKGHEK